MFKVACAATAADGTGASFPLILGGIEMAWELNNVIAVRIDVGPSIMLQSGAWFDFAAPQSSPFTIEDIAHGLANICRYSGQCSRFYSVAEHSLLVSDVAVGFELEALMHDAAEAFL